MFSLNQVFFVYYRKNLAHYNRTIAIVSDFRINGIKSLKIPQKERKRFWAQKSQPEIANR